MKFIHDEKVQGKERKRKIKGVKGLATGIVLAGLFAIGSQEGYADEVTTPSTTGTQEGTQAGSDSLAVAVVEVSNATNLSEPQPEATAEHVEALTQANQTVGGSVDVDVENSAFNQAVDEAKKVGVEIKEESPQVYDNLNQAEQDLQNQAKKVTEAKDTKVEVDTIKKEAETAAEKAKVSIVKDSAKTYTDNNNQALADAREQVGRAETATQTQTQINRDLPQAEKEARESGVEITVDSEVKYRDVKEALNKLGEIVGDLRAKSKAQLEIDSSLALALEEAKKQGVNVTVNADTKLSDIETAINQTAQAVADLKAKAQVKAENQDNLVESVKNAMANGVTVTTETAKSYTEAGQGKADYEKQIADLNTARANQAKADKIISDAVSNAKASGTTIKDGGTVTVPSDQAEIEAKKIADEIAKIVQENSGKDKSSKNKVDEIDAQNQSTLPNSSIDGYTPSGSTTHLKATTLGDFKVVSTGDLKNPQVYIVKKDGSVLSISDSSKIVTNINWKNTPLEAVDGGFIKSPNGTIWGHESLYNYGNYSQGAVIEIKKWYRIKDAIQTADGKIHDGYILFDVAKRADGLTPKNEVFVWNQGEAINSIDDAAPVSAPISQGDGIRTVIKLDSPDNTNNYLWVANINDFDAGQYIDLDEGQVSILAVGGGMSTRSTNPREIRSHEELGYTFGHNKHDINALDGVNSIPDGTVLFGQWHNQYNTIIRNTPGGYGAVVARSDYGLNANVSIIIPEPPKEAISKKIQVEAKTHDVNFTASISPVVLTAKTQPITVELNVHDVNVATVVHPVDIKQTPKNEKDVKNSIGESIDGHLIVKGSEISWGTGGEVLKAGRPQFSSIVRTDYLRTGQTVDMEKTRASNSDIEFTYNSEKHAVIQTIPSRILAEANLDQTKAFVLPVGRIYTTVDNDGGTYENVFDTTFKYADSVIIDKDGKVRTEGEEKTYKTTSNKVKVSTPTPSKPTKDVVDENDKSINGQSVLPNSRMDYKLKQNFKQYKGIKATDEQIAKNFLFIEDYDEKSLDGKSMSIRSILAENGDPVEQLLEMHHVLSLDTLDATLKDLVVSSGISPVGEFYMWVAKDPKVFYEAYVKKGLDITYNLSFKINKEFKEGEIINSVFQIDFRNGYIGDTVKNPLPLLEVKKSVLNKDKEDIDGKEVALGDEISYKLEGWVVPTNRGYGLWEYRFVDTLQVSHDEYQGYKVYTKVDFIYNGKDYKAGEEIDFSEVTHVSYDARTGLFELNFNKDFLETVSRDKEFGVDVELFVKRIAYGEVVNEYKLYVNGNQIISNKVTTYTSAPSQLEQPQEVAQVLPKTNAKNSTSAVVLGIGMLALAGLGFAKRKDEF